MNNYKIVKIVSNQYTIYLDGIREIAVAMGKLRQGEKPIVGDEVEVERIDGKLCIQKVLERKNRLYRPAIANVDQALIVCSAKEPDFSNTLVDRLIFLISYYDIKPIIVITKMDLVKDNDMVYEYIQDYRNSGYKVVLTGKDLALNDIKEVLKDKVSVLTGQSGAGKSTLLNRLDSSFALATQEISKALNRGKHTTRHSELYEVASGWLADTPGFSSLDFSYINGYDLSRKIPDFNLDGCRFKDCMHINEPNCVIKDAVNKKMISKYRYQNYLEVVNLCDKVKEWEK